MCKNMKFILPIPPSVNHYMNRRGNHSYLNANAVKFNNEAKEIILKAIKDNKWKKPDENTWLEVEYTFYFNRAGRDDNNCFKMLNDILQKSGIIKNDSKIITRTKNIFINKNNPHVEVSITVSEKLGVFKNKNEYDNFVNRNCKKCNNNYQKCDLMKEFLDNRFHNYGVSGTCKGEQS